jgi:EAL domain-containing protein (putative c-di-GMP-specific phosphodiesterase class I)
MLGTGPDTFIPVAEEMGLIADLSFMVIGKALEDAKEWDASLTLSVNISPFQLRDPWFSQKLLKLLVEHNFPPERLDVEITENALLENVGLVRSMITSLRNQGIKISLDDFGTGYSSLAQLRSLPFDRLKIDRSFVSELRENGSGTKIVDAIIRLGDGLDMPVTAEGVEDASILGALASFKSLKAQGYHFGRPESAAAVRKRLADLGLLVQLPGLQIASQPQENDTRKQG